MLAVILLVLGRAVFMPQIHLTNASDIHAWPFGLHVLIVLGDGSRARRARLRTDDPPFPPGLSQFVAELASRGKHLVGEPYFVPGTPLLLDRRHRRRRARATSPSCARAAAARGSSACSGRRARSRSCSRACWSKRASCAASSPTIRRRSTPTGRVDLRDRLAFTIDPDTAKDFDDALTVEEDRAFVHIADVSWFVQAGTPLDRGAAERAFSVYVPGLVSPMLPPELSEELCSLRPNVDRLCVTVEFPLDGGEPTFYRSVIRSARPADLRAGRGDPRRPRARRARADRGAAPSRAAGAGAARQAVRPRRAARRELRGRLRLRRPGRGRARLARVRAARAHAGRGADDPRQRARRRAARRPPPRGALPRPRAARAAGRLAAARTPRRPRHPDPARARPHGPVRRRGASPARPASS